MCEAFYIEDRLPQSCGVLKWLELSEDLSRGSPEIVGIADRLVGNHLNQYLEKLGFSLLRREHLVAIGCGDEMNGFLQITGRGGGLSDCEQYTLRYHGREEAINQGGELDNERLDWVR